MRIAICDDSSKDLEYITNLLKEMTLPPNTIFSSFCSGNEIIEAFETGQRFDIIFLDVDMPQISGIEVGNSIRKYDQNVIIIFLTSYSEFAIDAFECEAFRYILKPCDREKLKAVLTSAIHKLGVLNKYHLVKDKHKKFRIPISDIYYVECCKKHVIYHLKDRKLQIKETLSNVYDELSKYGFYQVHQGYIVNLEKIKSFDECDIILEDERRVFMSVRKKTEVLIAYSVYLERYM